MKVLGNSFYFGLMSLVAVSAISMSSIDARAEKNSRDFVIAVSTQTIGSAEAMLAALAVIHDGLVVEGNEYPMGICQAQTTVYGVNAKPDGDSPLKSAYITINMTWGCEAARDLLIEKINGIAGLGVLPWQSIVSFGPAVIRTN